MPNYKIWSIDKQAMQAAGIVIYSLPSMYSGSDYQFTKIEIMYE